MSLTLSETPKTDSLHRGTFVTIKFTIYVDVPIQERVMVINARVGKFWRHFLDLFWNGVKSDPQILKCTHCSKCQNGFNYEFLYVNLLAFYFLFSLNSSPTG